MIILIDNGHGLGDPNGSPDGIYKEWAWAREMAGLIRRELIALGQDARLLVEEMENIPLGERVRRVNAVVSSYGRNNVIVVSIHSNAGPESDGQWHDGRWSGFVAEVAQNASAESKQLADAIWARAIEAGLKGNRSVVEKPGQRYLTANLAICRDTLCPAVLTESAFHDTRDGVRLLTTEKPRIALAHANGIMDYINAKQHKA